MDNTLGHLPKVRLGDWISEGWNMFSAQWKVWVVNALILFCVTFVPIVIVSFLFAVLAPLAAGGAGLSAVAVFLVFFVIGLSMLASAYLSAGMYRCAFMQLRGEKISTGDLFSGGDKLGKMIVASVLVAFFSF